MKTEDIKIGGHYEARVSGNLVDVVVFQGPFEASSGRPFFRVRNTATGRIIAMTAARLRRPILTEAEREARREAARAGLPFIYGSHKSAGTLLGRETSAVKRGYLIGMGVV